MPPPPPRPRRGVPPTESGACPRERRAYRSKIIARGFHAPANASTPASLTMNHSVCGRKAPRKGGGRWNLVREAGTSRPTAACGDGHTPAQDGSLSPRRPKIHCLSAPIDEQDSGRRPWDDPAKIGLWCGRSGHASADPYRNLVPSAHMRSRTTASFRATATMARRRPLVFISRMPQASGSTTRWSV